MFSKSWSMELNVVFTAYPSVNAKTFVEEKGKNRKQVTSMNTMDLCHGFRRHLDE